MRRVINPHELTDKLVIQKKTVKYVGGFPQETVTDVYELDCKKKTVSTKEFIEANRDNTSLTYKFIVHQAEIDEEMYVLYDGKTWNIKHVHEIDDFFYELTATAFTK